MANAKECDRCGELYRNNDSSFSVCIIERKNFMDHYYDLCPDCYKSFREWIDKHKQKEDAK